MISDQRAAELLNATMVAILGAVLLGFAAWSFAGDLAVARKLLSSLSAEEQRVFGRLAQSAGFFALTITLVLSQAVRWLKNRRAAQQAAAQPVAREEAPTS